MASLDAVHALPGVKAAALASQIPLGGNVDMYGMHLESRAGSNPAEDPSAMRYAVTPRYLEALAIPLRAGRSITDADDERAPRVVLLNETAANQLFPEGRHWASDSWWAAARAPRTTPSSGVVGNTLHRGLDGEQEMQVYVPSAQWGEEGGMTLVVHTAVNVAVDHPIGAARSPGRSSGDRHLESLDAGDPGEPDRRLIGGSRWRCSPGSPRSR